MVAGLQHKVTAAVCEPGRRRAGGPWAAHWSYNTTQQAARILSFSGRNQPAPALDGPISMPMPPPAPPSLALHDMDCEAVGAAQYEGGEAQRRHYLALPAYPARSHPPPEMA